MSFDPAFRQAGTTRTSFEVKEEADLEAKARATNEAIAAKIPNLRNDTDPNKLTPLRAHYLKKQLVKLQVEKEVQQLNQKDALSTFGPPFKPSAASRNADLPLARFIFHHFVLTFPFLRSAPSNFFSDKVQVFMDMFLERNISGTDDREEETKRRKITAKLERSITLLIAAAIQVGGDVGGEEVVRISDEDRARALAAQASVKAALAGKPFERDDAVFDVNVIGVRTRTTKGRLRHRHHDEFVIRTRRQGQPDVYVARRYGDFQRLADTLRVDYPDEDISRPPAKDRSNADVPPSPVMNESSAVDSARSSIDGQMEGLQIDSRAGPSSSRHRLSSSASSSSRPNVAPPPSQLTREKNRLTLRAYLRALLAIPPVADSPVLADFLLGEPIQLTASEEADCRSREALDAVRADEATRFNDEASKRVSSLKGHLATFKADLVQRDGLSRVFGTIKSTPNIEDLPESYRALLAWARISAASTLFHMFMGSDTSSDLFGQLKRIHGLMPYFMMRQILRISNPVTMIRGVIDLFLAQPFGQRSLLQRMFSSSLQEEARELQEMVNAVRAKVDDEVLCEKVRLFVYAPQDVQQVYRDDAASENVDLLTTILRSPEEPRLGRQQIHRVIRASRAYEVYKRHRASLKNPDVEDEGPQDDDAWLYEDLHVLLRLSTRLRDKEQMLELIFEGVTAELLKDIVTIFYSPLAQVYKAANIADSLYDLQVFINDLIKTVEATEEMSYTDPQRTVQVFIDLVARHEARFYAFVHQVHSKGAGLFDGLMHWIELFLNFVRTAEPSKGEKEGQKQRQGLGSIDLEVCLPAGGADRAAALAEIDALVVHAYRLKLLREMKLRRRIADREVRGAAQGVDARGGSSSIGLMGGQGAEEDDENAFFATMVDNLGFGKGFEGEVADAEAEGDEDDDDDTEDEDEGEDDESAGKDATRKAGIISDDESGTSGDESESGGGGGHKAQASSWRPPAPTRQASTLTITGNATTPRVEKDLPALPPHQEEESEEQKRARRRRRRQLAKPRPPTLRVIPEMVPLFVEMLRPMLRPARSASASSFGPALTAGGGGGGGGDSSQHQNGAQMDAAYTQPQAQGWGSWIAGGFMGGGGDPGQSSGQHRRQRSG